LNQLHVEFEQTLRKVRTELQQENNILQEKLLQMSNQLNKLQEKDINLTSKCHSMEISLGELRETKDALESKLITTDTALKDSDVKVFNITVHRDQLMEENEMLKMKLEALKKKRKHCQQYLKFLMQR